MKPIITAIGAVVLAGLFVIAAIWPVNSQARQPDVLTAFFFPTLISGQYLAGESLIGSQIYGKDGKIVGRVDDLILSKDHRVIGIVMGVGGALGFGEKRVGVRLTALKVEQKKAGQRLTLGFPAAALKDAATFKRPDQAKTAPKKSLIEKATEAARKITTGTADLTKKVLKKAARKTSETVAKAKEATRKAVEPAKPINAKAEPATPAQ